MFPFTVHAILRNEERFVWFSLNSVLPWVQKVLIYDTGSTDKTLAVVKTINNHKISLFEKGVQAKVGITKLRNEMIKKTLTNWFLLLDGDEVWNRQTIQNFLKFVVSQPRDIWAVFLRTRNCVGDVWHCLPEDAGRYEIAGRRGNLNIRAYRKLPGCRWEGDYPLEHYGDINRQPEHLKFFDGYYWHLTHLSRTTATNKVAGFRRHVVEEGIAVKREELPEVFFSRRPKIVSDPLTRRSFTFELAAKAVTPLKLLKRKYL